ncbi:Protease OS=Streptomyces glaucescens OX=1907 GN=SGLAU_22225 PE=3 SV=1 [Streptomyces glaucescens]
MPNPSVLRAAVTVSALLLTSLLAGCSDDEAEDEDLTRQQLDWKDCPAPSQAQGGGNRPVPAAERRRVAVRHDEGAPRLGQPRRRHHRPRDHPGQGQRRREPADRLRSSSTSAAPAAPASPHCPRSATTTRNCAPATTWSASTRAASAAARPCCARTTNGSTDAFFQQDATPDDPAERTALLANTEKFNEACEQNSAKILPHVRTTDAARDMDLMRQVLDDDKLHYFGISYGTELGGVYAHLFPEHVGRAVLDAVVDPDPDAGTERPRAGEGLPAGARQLRRELRLEGGGTARSGTARRHQGPDRTAAEGPRPRTGRRDLPP